MGGALSLLTLGDGWFILSGRNLRRFLVYNFSCIPEPYRLAHKVCSRNKDVVSNSKQCGCFYCLNVYPASDVIEWIEEKVLVLVRKK